MATTSTPEAALVARGVRKAYGDIQALAGFDLAVAPGEVCALLGPNGAGKTTFVSIVAGLCRADAGDVAVAGVDALRRPHLARALLGVAPQELGVYPSLSVADNLRVFGELAGLRGNEIAKRINEVAAGFGLGDLLRRRVRSLSGGEKRRVHTAASVLHRPPLLLLDEPTAGVDVTTRASVLDAVRRLAEEDGCAVCYSTHYFPEVEALGATVAILDAGRLVARGRPDELVANHGTAAVELVFEGSAPALEPDGSVPMGTIERRDNVVRIAAERPAETMAGVISRLGPDAERLRAVEVVSSGLESVFLNLTGRRFADGGDNGDGGRGG